MSPMSCGLRGDAHRERPHDDVDRAVYRDGRRTAEPLELGYADDAFPAGGGLAWVGLYRPTEQEFAAVAAEFGLHSRATDSANAIASTSAAKRCTRRRPPAFRRTTYLRRDAS